MDNSHTFTEEQAADFAGTLMAMTMQMQVGRREHASRIGEILIAKLEMLGYDQKTGMVLISRATDISKALL